MNKIQIQIAQGSLSFNLLLCKGLAGGDRVNVVFDVNKVHEYWHFENDNPETIRQYFRQGDAYSQICNAEYRSYDSRSPQYFLPVMECVPLWTFDFATDFIALLTDLGFRYRNGLVINIIEVSENCSIDRLSTYFGVRLMRFFGVTVSDSDEYIKPRLNSVFGGVLDVISSRLNSLLHAPEWSDVIRFAMTLYDIHGRYNFVCANASSYVADVADKVEREFNGCQVEAFTTRLLKCKIDKPVSLTMGKDNIYYIEIQGKKISFVWDESNKTVDLIGMTGEQELFSSTELSLPQQNGLALNFRLVRDLSIKMYYLPLWAHMGEGFSPAYAIVLISKEADLVYAKQSMLLQKLRDMFYPVLMIENNLLMSQIRLDQTKTAIGAIMSRNGSHNIGSHVLAALSHNIGTMPDDRVLYQYIQHRMDYIATATTELPVWNQPLSFVGNLVRTFLMQRHLLDYITGSEGLKAYQFQNRTVDTMNEGCQPNTIRLHVRRVGDDDSGWTEENNYSVEESKAQNFIPYPECPVSENALLHDLEVAIPGGIVGQHAFFTILENILRNAAKHEWAKLKKDEKERAKRKYLDVHVDFKDNPEEGIVEVVAWTDNEYGRIHYGKDAYAGKSKSLSPLEIEEYLSKDKDDEGLDLSGLDADHKKLQVRMARSFIGTSGGLRKENWGLAEMRISAGYLNTAGISEIGGLDKKQSSELNLIKPIMVLNGDHYCLGYHFHMPKPRELLIVIPQEITIDAKDVLAANRKLKRHGVAVIAEEDVRNESSKRERSSRLSYAYVLLKEFRKLDEDVEDGQFHDMRKWKLPFRVITASAEVLRPSAAAGFDRRADFASERKDFFEENVFKAWIAKVSGSDESAKTESEQLLFDIYRSWACHLKKEKKLEKIPISIDLKGSDSNARGGSSGASSDSGGNAEKSLISDVDLLWVVFGHCFNTAVDSYLKTSVRAGDELKTILKEMQSLSPRKIGFSVVDPKGRNLSLDEMIRDQLRKWCGQLQDRESAIRFSQCLTDIDDTPSGDWDYLDIPAGLLEFVNYLATTILGQAKVFLSKYEEHYSTLPIALVPKTEDNVEQKISKLDNQVILSTVPEIGKIKLLKEKGKRVRMGESEIVQSDVLAYWRHEDACCTRTEESTDASGKKMFIPIQATYLEPLSGSQSYINSFSLLTRGDELQRARFTVKLIETGLVKVLIVDERLKKFEQDHSEVKCTFAKIGVAALGEDSEAVDKLFAISDSREKVLSDIAIKDYGTKVGDYDILVIHQGIIDKKIHNHSDSEMINSFVNRLKQEIRYVVVTTGRGTPANIPGNVRVLPFSVVESTLFKKYPEKLVLVDAIMNILPSGGKETP